MRGTMNAQGKTSRGLFEVLKSRIVDEVSRSIPHWVDDAFEGVEVDRLTIVEKAGPLYASIESGPDGPVVWISAASPVTASRGEFVKAAKDLSDYELGDKAISLTMPFREFFEMLALEARNYGDYDATLSECIRIMAEIRDQERERKRRE